MKLLSSHTLTRAALGSLLLMLSPTVRAGSSKDKPYRYSDVDMPVSLVHGAVRTPEFTVKHTQFYWILIRAKKRIPFLDLKCGLGLTAGPLDAAECQQAGKEQLLQANWTVFEGGQAVARGSTPAYCACEFDDEGMMKIFGPFKAEVGMRYVVEMTFTKEGSPLNLADPHMIVTRVGYE